MVTNNPNTQSLKKGWKRLLSLLFDDNSTSRQPENGNESPDHITTQDTDSQYEHENNHVQNSDGCGSGYGRYVVERFEPAQDERGRDIDGLYVTRKTYKSNVPKLSIETAEALVENTPEEWREQVKRSLDKVAKAPRKITD